MKDERPVTSQQVLDPEMLVTAIRNADLEPCQLSARPALSKITRVLCPRMCLDLVSIGPAMLYTGAMPKDCFTVSFVMNNPGVGQSFNFRTKFSGGGYMGFFPPGAELDAACPEGCKDAILSVPSEVFLAAVELHFPEMPEDLLKHGGGLWVGLHEQQRIRSLLGSIEKVVELAIGDLGEECICRQLESDLLVGFLAALRDGCGQRVKEPTSCVGGRHHRFRRVRDFVAEHLHQPIHLDDLCREIGLSAGGTENAFRDYLGISPIEFLRHQRLHCARRTLLREAAVPGAVKKAALEAGFWHLGRFAGDYRRLFGESPKETLAMAARS
jgi:AraC-like DNA-binding protein